MVNWDWSQAAQGAGGGAMAGAPFGMPWAGAAIGGLMGGFMGGGNQYDAQMQAFANQDPLQRGPAAQGQLSSFRGNQASLINSLEAQARGEGPSLAAQQLQAATDRNTKQSQALAAGASGPNAALAQFQAQQGNQMLGAQAGQDAALMRIQEQYNAQNQLGLTLHGARGMDEQMSQYNAGARNGRDSDNLSAGMQGRGQNLQALSALWGQKAGQPGMGEQILGAGAGLYGFHAGQQGNQPQQAPAPGPQPQQWFGPPGGTGGSPFPSYSHRQGTGLVNPWGPGAGSQPAPQPPGQPMDPYAGQQGQAPQGWWNTAPWTGQ